MGLIGSNVIAQVAEQARVGVADKCLARRRGGVDAGDPATSTRMAL
jgi:hypothetical protein